MVKFAVGQPYRRTEDPRFLTGRGRYVADIAAPGEAHAMILRSPHAHAVIRAIDVAQALRAPGVLAVYTGEDTAADGIGDLPCLPDFEHRDGKKAVKPLRPVLARGRVRFVGDNVAFVVAETPAQAQDALELVEVDYEALPAVTETAKAFEEGAPTLHDSAPGNRAFFWQNGDARAVDKAFAAARRTVALEVVNNRVVPNPMEPRAVLGHFDAGTGRYTLYTPSQGAHRIRTLLAEHTLGVPAKDIRVITPDVGGAFGTKLFHYAEEVLVLWASKKLGRPVRWTGERADCFLADTHGRDHVSRAELALDGEGRFLALRVHTIAAMGAYASMFNPYITRGGGTPMLVGVYDIAAAHVTVEGAYTNTVPVDAYRGAGRPEAQYLLERLVDVAARETGIAPDALRRRNFIAPEAMPYATAFGKTYDSGDFEAVMAAAMAAADWPGMATRRKEAEARGRRRGIGMATYIESCGGDSEEDAAVAFADDGQVELLVGTQSGGHGHETAFAQIAADALGLPFERFRVVQGDTDVIPSGGGTGGSRSLPVGGAVLAKALAATVAKGREIAAHLLQSGAGAVTFAEGRYALDGGARYIAIDDVAKAAKSRDNLPRADMETGLGASAHIVLEKQTFPNGCHVCEVEIDRETGALEIVRYVVVDDFGTLVNPLLVEGQVHGGVVQGIGQALCEGVVYDETGQLLTASFMDYAMPRADDVGAIEVEFKGVPCRTNPLGVKGAGEAGAIGSCPAVVNAVIDALAPFGVRHLDMPVTAEKIWRAIDGTAMRKGGRG